MLIGFGDVGEWRCWRCLVIVWWFGVDDIDGNENDNVAGVDEFDDAADDMYDVDEFWCWSWVG